MTTPAYRATADLFEVLGHPARLRINHVPYDVADLRVFQLLHIARESAA